jgi:2-polyprenyl-3-methyl-5-hydroxy-6-metoxy-1,4-benzoquinol methylase
MTGLDRLVQRWRIRVAAHFLRPGDRVLDIGTADGALFRMVPGLAESVGVDPDLRKDMLPQLPNVSFYAGLFPQVLPRPIKFDAITMLAVLEHIPPGAQSQLAKDCAEHLRPGGKLIITVPSPTVDRILAVGKAFHLIDGMSLEQHYGFEVSKTPLIFLPHDLRLLLRKRFQLGLNNLFVFESPTA